MPLPPNAVLVAVCGLPVFVLCFVSHALELRLPKTDTSVDVFAFGADVIVSGVEAEVFVADNLDFGGIGTRFE